MKLVVGLGNPGEKYDTTPHNAGFMFLDTIASNFVPEKKFNSEIAESGSGEKKVIYAKPQASMNNSGSAVQLLLQYYKIDSENFIVIHDEIDIKLGEVKLALNSSSAGHKGVQSIMDEIRTANFYRIRIGIDTRSSREDLATEDFVLRPSPPPDLDILYDTSFPKAQKLLDEFLRS